MKIYTVSEHNKPFVWLTTGLAIKNLGNILNCEVITYTLDEWKNRKLHHDSDNDIIVIFEAAYMELGNFSTTELRSYYPNAKFVCLGSDTIYFVMVNKWGGYQFNSPLDVDLFLETMWDTYDIYKNRGINVDHWDWTASEKLISMVSEMPQTTWEEREYDFISVLSPHTINRVGSYRHNMVKYITNKDYTFTQGGGDGMGDNNYDKIHESYCNSRVAIGTSSHDNPSFFGRKGYRDAIAPFMGTVLIYDNYKDVVKDYNVGSLIPIYQYGNFDELISCYDWVNNNATQRNVYLENQKEFFRNHTIETQLFNKLKKHGII